MVPAPGVAGIVGKGLCKGGTGLRRDHAWGRGDQRLAIGRQDLDLARAKFDRATVGACAVGKTLYARIGPRQQQPATRIGRVLRHLRSQALDEKRKVLRILLSGRSEERRVGQACVSTCSSRWSPFP